MRFFLSPFWIALASLMLGAIFSAWMGVSAKVEIDYGSLVGHLPMFTFGAAVSWLALMILRKYLMSKVAANG